MMMNILPRVETKAVGVGEQIMLAINSDPRQNEVGAIVEI
jgi:hypothetical protein